jgi:hypothetical protein
MKRDDDLAGMPEEFQFHYYVELLAKCDVLPAGRRRWIAESPFHAVQLDEVDARWKVRISEDRPLRRAFDTAWNHYRSIFLEEAALDAASAPPPVAAPSVASPRFSTAPVYVEEPIHTAPLDPPVEHGPHRLARTSLAFDVPNRSALPFARSRLGDAPHLARTRLGGTSISLDAPSRPVLPFASGLPTARVQPVIGPSSEVSLPPRQPLTGTSLSLEPAKSRSLPFVARPAVSQEAVPEARAALTGTALALDVPRTLANAFSTPFFQGPRKRPSAEAVKATEPAAASAAMTSQSPLRLSLEQHASLCAEIAFAVAKGHDRQTVEPSILTRYGLTPDLKVAIDHAYRAQIEADPARRAAWHDAFRTYAGWLATQRP